MTATVTAVWTMAMDVDTEVTDAAMVATDADTAAMVAMEAMEAMELTMATIKVTAFVLWM